MGKESNLTCRWRREPVYDEGLADSKSQLPRDAEGPSECELVMQMMTSFRFLQPAAAALLASVALISAIAAQAPEGARSSPGNPLSTSRAFRVPRNLKALPKDLSGRQVNSIMEEWSRSLGVRCDACHSEATETLAADDDSNLNFADDSKPLKVLARSMYEMTEEINSIHIAKIEGSGMPVTCGTCHRGHISPEPFVSPSHGGPTARESGAHPIGK